MKKKFLAAGLLIFVIISNILLSKVSAESIISSPSLSSAADLITAVNNLRASQGLAPYQTNSILMSVAQAQAEYLLSIGCACRHTDANGRYPFERALDAGYLVAGDLSQGGYYSENITGGVGQTADEAVQVWTGDSTHKTTMLSGVLRDVGAGVAANGNTFYYVLDAGLSTGGTPVAYTPPAPIVQPATPSIVPNTPNPDGSIVHIVKGGDTLGSISIAYGVPLANILKLNKLLLNSVIYPNQKITIQAAYTPMPTQPTATPTLPPTSTPWPTSTPTSIPTLVSPTPTPRPALPVSAAGGAVGAIVVTALILAGLTALLGRKRKSSPDETKRTGA